MTVLREVAEQLGAHERTLRRGLAEGLIRGRRPTPRSVELAAGEIGYLRASWPLLAGLRDALRTERNVRLAVLMGSAARGELRTDSDVDVLVRVADGDWRALDRLRERLAHAAGRPVDLVSLEAAEADPLLLDAVLRDGRVLVDREGEWPGMLAAQARVARAAELAADRLRDELHALVTELRDDP
jgi:predicted nucleotidyltransferase